MFWKEFSLSKTALLLLMAAVGTEQFSAAGAGKEAAGDYELTQAGDEFNKFVIGLPRVMAGRVGQVGRDGVVAITNPTAENQVKERENVDHLVAGLQWIGEALQRDLPPKAGNAIETERSAR